MHPTVFESRSCSEGGEGVVGDGVFEGQTVLFFDLRRRVRNAVGEPAVVGEDQESRGVGVEAARWHEAGYVWHQVGDGPAATLVAHGRQIARWLVQGEVDEGSGKVDRLAVKLD